MALVEAGPSPKQKTEKEPHALAHDRADMEEASAARQSWMKRLNKKFKYFSLACVGGLIIGPFAPSMMASISDGFTRKAMLGPKIDTQLSADLALKRLNRTAIGRMANMHHFGRFYAVMGKDGKLQGFEFAPIGNGSATISNNTHMQFNTAAAFVYCEAIALKGRENASDWDKQALKKALWSIEHKTGFTPTKCTPTF